MSSKIYSIALLAVLGASFVTTPSVSAEKIMTYGNQSSSTSSTICSEKELKDLTQIIRMEANKGIQSELQKNPYPLQAYSNDPKVMNLMNKLMNNKKISSGMDLMIEGVLEETVCNPEINTAKVTPNQIISMYKASQGNTQGISPAVETLKMVRL
jgi:hypothetical protein